MIPLHEPLFDIDDERYVLEALRTGWVSSGGPFVRQFEEEFAKYIGVEEAVSVCSGTTGLQLSIEIVKRMHHISGNFEVLCPVLSFIASANAIIHAGGSPVFLDTNSGSMLVGPEVLLDALNNGYLKQNQGLPIAKSSGWPLLCVVPVSLMGWACNRPALDELCDEWNLPIVEDAAEALGSQYSDGRFIGNSKGISVFSFNGNKILTTGGGGMIVSPDKKIMNMARHLSTTARVDHLRFVHDEVGYNFRMINLVAGLGLSQLKKMKERLVRKNAIFEVYKGLLADWKVGRVHEEANSKCNHWLINVVFNNQELRERALDVLLDNSIQARPLWTPFHLQPALRSFKSGATKYPNAELVWKRVLSLPSSPHLTDDEISRIVWLIKSATD